MLRLFTASLGEAFVIAITYTTGATEGPREGRRVERVGMEVRAVRGVGGEMKEEGRGEEGRGEKCERGGRVGERRGREGGGVMEC